MLALSSIDVFCCSATNIYSQFNWSEIFHPIVNFGWWVVMQSMYSLVNSRWIWLLVKPLLYKDEMASAPNRSTSQKDYLKVVWKTSHKMIVSCFLAFYTYRQYLIDNTNYQWNMHKLDDRMEQPRMRPFANTLCQLPFLNFHFSIVTTINMSKSNTLFFSSLLVRIISNWFQPENLFKL